MTHYPKFFFNKGLVGHVYNLKNSLKFKLLAFWRKLTPFIDQKCTYEKVTKIWAGPPPIWIKSKRIATFFGKPSLRESKSEPEWTRERERMLACITINLKNEAVLWRSIKIQNFLWQKCRLRAVSQNKWKKLHGAPTLQFTAPCTISSWLIF